MISLLDYADGGFASRQGSAFADHNDHTPCLSIFPLVVCSGRPIKTPQNTTTRKSPGLSKTMAPFGATDYVHHG
jgi:hypothetical protein